MFNELDELTKENIALALWMKEFKANKIPPNIKKHILSNKNSPEAFGQRMHSRIQYLLDNPDSFTPTYKKRYENVEDYPEDTTLQRNLKKYLLAGNNFNEATGIVNFDKL